MHLYLNDSMQFYKSGSKKSAFMKYSFFLTICYSKARFYSQKNQVSSNLMSDSFDSSKYSALSKPFNWNLNTFFFYRRQKIFDNMFRIPQQKRKRLVFNNLKLRKEEEAFLYKYFVKTFLAYSFYTKNQIVETKSQFYRRIEFKKLSILADAYVNNIFIHGLEDLNPKFISFFYFLTKSFFILKSDSKIFSRKILIRNLFFLFIFRLQRLQFLKSLTLTNFFYNSEAILSLKQKKRSRFRLQKSHFSFFGVIPLIYYSPFKVSYILGNSAIVRNNLSLKLKFISDYSVLKFLITKQFQKNNFFFQSSLKLFKFYLKAKFRIRSTFIKKVHSNLIKKHISKNKFFIKNTVSLLNSFYNHNKVASLHIHFPHKLQSKHLVRTNSLLFFSRFFKLHFYFRRFQYFYLTKKLWKNDLYFKYKIFRIKKNIDTEEFYFNGSRINFKKDSKLNVFLIRYRFENFLRISSKIKFKRFIKQKRDRFFFTLKKKVKYLYTNNNNLFGYNKDLINFSNFFSDKSNIFLNFIYFKKKNYTNVLSQFFSLQKFPGATLKFFKFQFLYYLFQFFFKFRILFSLSSYNLFCFIRILLPKFLIENFNVEPNFQIILSNYLKLNFMFFVNFMFFFRKFLLLRFVTTKFKFNYPVLLDLTSLNANFILNTFSGFLNFNFKKFNYSEKTILRLNNNLLKYFQSRVVISIPKNIFFLKKFGNYFFEIDSRFGDRIYRGFKRKIFKFWSYKKTNRFFFGRRFFKQVEKRTLDEVFLENKFRLLKINSSISSSFLNKPNKNLIFASKVTKKITKATKNVRKLFYKHLKLKRRKFMMHVLNSYLPYERYERKFNRFLKSWISKKKNFIFVLTKMVFPAIKIIKRFSAFKVYRKKSKKLPLVVSSYKHNYFIPKAFLRKCYDNKRQLFYRFGSHYFSKGWKTSSYFNYFEIPLNFKSVSLSPWQISELNSIFVVNYNFKIMFFTILLNKFNSVILNSSANNNKRFFTFHNFPLDCVVSGFEEIQKWFVFLKSSILNLFLKLSDFSKFKFSILFSFTTQFFEFLNILKYYFFSNFSFFFSKHFIRFFFIMLGNFVLLIFLEKQINLFLKIFDFFLEKSNFMEISNNSKQFIILTVKRRKISFFKPLEIFFNFKQINNTAFFSTKIQTFNRSSLFNLKVKKLKKKLISYNRLKNKKTKFNKLFIFKNFRKYKKVHLYVNKRFMKFYFKRSLLQSKKFYVSLKKSKLYGFPVLFSLLSNLRKISGKIIIDSVNWDFYQYLNFFNYAFFLKHKFLFIKDLTFIRFLPIWFFSFYSFGSSFINKTNLNIKFLNGNFSIGFFTFLSFLKRKNLRFKHFISFFSKGEKKLKKSLHPFIFRNFMIFRSWLNFLRYFYFNLKVRTKSKFNFPLVRNRLSKKLTRTLSNDLINNPNSLFTSFLELQKSKVNKFPIFNSSLILPDINLFNRQVFLKNVFKKLYVSNNSKYSSRFILPKILNLQFHIKKGFSPFFLFRFFILNLKVLLSQFFGQLNFLLNEKAQFQSFFTSSEVRYYLSLLKSKIFKLYYIFFPKNILSSFLLKKLFREVLIFSPKLLFKIQSLNVFYLNSKIEFQNYFSFFSETSFGIFKNYIYKVSGFLKHKVSNYYFFLNLYIKTKQIFDRLPKIYLLSKNSIFTWYNWFSKFFSFSNFIFFKTFENKGLYLKKNQKKIKIISEDLRLNKKAFQNSLSSKVNSLFLTFARFKNLKLRNLFHKFLKIVFYYKYLLKWFFLLRKTHKINLISRFVNEKLLITSLRIFYSSIFSEKLYFLLVYNNLLSEKINYCKKVITGFVFYSLKLDINKYKIFILNLYLHKLISIFISAFNVKCIFTFSKYQLLYFMNILIITKKQLHLSNSSLMLPKTANFFKSFIFKFFKFGHLFFFIHRKLKSWKRRSIKLQLKTLFPFFLGIFRRKKIYFILKHKYKLLGLFLKTKNNSNYETKKLFSNFLRFNSLIYPLNFSVKRKKKLSFRLFKKKSLLKKHSDMSFSLSFYLRKYLRRPYKHMLQKKSFILSIYLNPRFLKISNFKQFTSISTYFSSFFPSFNSHFDNQKKRVSRFFSFFLNYRENFTKIFFLKLFFFELYTRYRAQNLSRYLFYRVVFLKTTKFFPRFYIIISRSRRNLFLTITTLAGRLLYKCTPGMLKFRGSDKMSTFVLLQTCLYFLKSYIELCSEVSLRSKPEYKRIAKHDRRLMLAERRRKKMLGIYNRKKEKEEKKRRKLEKSFAITSFFLITKGIRSYMIRIFLKALRRSKLEKKMVGVLKYPFISYTKCRIRKVRRI